MEGNGTVHRPTPLQLPDMNPIELVWGSMKYNLRKHVKPRNKGGLIKSARKFNTSSVDSKEIGVPQVFVIHEICLTLTIHVTNQHHYNIVLDVVNN